MGIGANEVEREGVGGCGVNETEQGEGECTAQGGGSLWPTDGLPAAGESLPGGTEPPLGLRLMSREEGPAWL